MSRPKKKKSDSTLVKLGPRLDEAVTALGNRNMMSYASTVRLLCMLGSRALIRSGTYQGWTLPEDFEEILDRKEEVVQDSAIPLEESAPAMEPERI
jgi:hypothetical protein